MSELNLTVDQATAVISEAKKDKFGEGPIYEGSMPESDDRRVEIATELVGHAVDAFTKENMRGEEVTDILRLAGVSVNGDGAWHHDAGAAPPEEATAEADAGPALVTLIGPDGSETTVPDDETIIATLVERGFTRKGEEQDESLAAGVAEAQDDPRAQLPPDDQEVDYILGGTVLELPFGQALKLYREGSGDWRTDEEKAIVDAAIAAETPERPPGTDPEHDPIPQPKVPIEPEGNPLDPDDPTDPDEIKGDPKRGHPDQIATPWEGYDSQSAVDIKKALDEEHSEEDISLAEKLTYVRDYENQRSRPRVRILKYIEKRLGELGESDPSDDAGPAGEGHRELDDQADAAAAADYTPKAGEVISGHLLGENDDVRQAIYDDLGNLPVPQDVENPPTMPEDLTECSADAVQSLHSQFNACLAYATWKLGLVISDEKEWKHIADVRKLEALKEVERTNPETGRPKAQDRVEAEAEADEAVQEAREKQHRAGARKVPLQKLVDIYSGNVEVLSRHWTMREEERQYARDRS